MLLSKKKCKVKVTAVFNDDGDYFFTREIVSVGPNGTQMLLVKALLEILRASFESVEENITFDSHTFKLSTPWF